MGTIAISSNVHVGTRVRGERMNQGWFAASPSALFTSFSFTGATAAQGISGHGDLPNSPVEFSIERRARDVLTDSLAVVAAQGLLNGRPFKGLSAWRDAGVQAGQLVRVQWSERNNATPGSPKAFDKYGVITVNEASVQGQRESLRFVLWPCSALFYVGTLSWLVTPAGYALLPVAT